LDSADIPWIAYKGVIAQTQLGLEAAHRPSNDLDVLVHHADFKRALQVLDEAACHHDEQFAGPWWQDWLGEVPVRPPGGIGLTIDLHHKLQQPGCPAPRHIGEWLDNRVHIALGGLSVPAPDAVSLGLLCAINVVKAFAHRELAGSHAMDLARILLREGPGFHADLEQFALRQGMTETLAMARQAVAALIGAPIPGKRARLAWEPDWIGMILTPSQQTDERMRGRTLLWALSEGRSLARVARFARDSWDAVASERSRRRHDVAPVAVRAATS